ncbi:hypothetical protein JXJ21_07535 [candidate division KSB1 bacterium]|nr:hypothetical protein [candidate division KSB1 bacterium]
MSGYLKWLAIFLSLSILIANSSQSKDRAVIMQIQNWNTALENDFRVTKSDSARISTDKESVHIEVAAAPAESLLLQYRNPFSIESDFAIHLRMKLNQVGRDDDGTGYRSRFEFRFNTGAPLNLGVRILINRDRYKVDNQYKIYRTDALWHDWHFEFRLDKKMLLMSRDGSYECAHEISVGNTSESPQPSAMQFEIYADKDLPTEVEIGELALSRLKPLAKSASSPSHRLKHTISPGEWPMFRRDRYHTGQSPLKGNMTTPEVQWAFTFGGSFGGSFVDDINGDGDAEILVMINGRLTAYRLDGTYLWDTPLENVYIFGMHDLDGDGQKELVLGAGFIQTVHVLDGKTGKVRYKCPYDQKYHVSGIKIAAINPDLRGQQIVICTRNEISYCLSFEDGIENGKVAWTYDYKMRYFTPEFALVDMDLDGVLELVVVTYGNFIVYSGLDGSVKMQLEANTGRNYGLLVVQDIDNDRYPDIIMFADQLREHIAVVKNENGKSLRLLWDKFFEQNYPVDQMEMRVFDDAVDDFDGDGQIEILYGLWDETSYSNWRTLLVDAVSGETKLEIPDAYLVNVLRFFPEQPPQLLLSSPQNRKELNTTHLRVVSVANRQPVTLVELRNRILITNQSFIDFPLNRMKNWSASQSNLKSERFSRGGFFKKLDDSGKITAIEFIQGKSGNSLESIWSREAPFGQLEDASFLTFYPDLQKEAAGFLFSKNDNHYYLLSEGGDLIGKYPCGGQVCQPVAGALSDDGILRILTADPFGNLKCLKPLPDKKPPIVEWEQPIMGNQLGWGTIQGQGVPIVADLDSDGQNEVIFSQPPDKLVFVNQCGKTVRSFTFAKAPKYITFGQFTGRDKWDLFISYSTGSVSTKSQVVPIDASQTAAWELTCGNGPPTVFDLTGNGYEDIVLRDLFERRSLDGLTGRDTFPITQWCGYHLPMIADPDGEEPFIIWTGGVYSVVAEKLTGEQLWWRPFFTYRHPCGLADVDGDGQLEIGGVTLGQLYNWPNIYPVDGPDEQFVCMDALTGRTKWEFTVNSSISGTITADVDGDGNPEFIFGTTDGHLLALRGGDDQTRRIAFDVSLPAAVGTPIVADLFGTGAMQILVGCADGKLYCIE